MWCLCTSVIRWSSMTGSSHIAPRSLNLNHSWQVTTLPLTSWTMPRPIGWVGAACPCTTAMIAGVHTCCCTASSWTCQIEYNQPLLPRGDILHRGSNSGARTWPRTNDVSVTQDNPSALHTTATKEARSPWPPTATASTWPTGCPLLPTLGGGWLGRIGSLAQRRSCARRAEVGAPARSGRWPAGEHRISGTSAALRAEATVPGSSPEAHQAGVAPVELHAAERSVAAQIEFSTHPCHLLRADRAEFAGASSPQPSACGHNDGSSRPRSAAATCSDVPTCSGTSSPALPLHPRALRSAAMSTSPCARQPLHLNLELSDREVKEAMKGRTCTWWGPLLFGTRSDGSRHSPESFSFLARPFA
jgi:hypothetical protein